MSVIGPLLAFGSALAFSGFDVTRKQAGVYLHPLALTFWLQVVSLPFFGAWTLYVGWQLEPGWWGPGLLSILLQATANALFLWALNLAPLSRTVPFLALTPVLSGLAAWTLLGETPSPLAQGGMGLVTLGAFALALVRGQDGFRIERGSLLVIGVAALWSAGGAVDKAALAHAHPATHALIVALGILILFGIERRVRTGRRGLDIPAGAGRSLFLAGLFGCAAMGLQLSAYAFTFVSTVETVKRAVGGIAALALGRLAFDETIEARSLGAVLVMSLGTVLVLWPS